MRAKDLLLPEERKSNIANKYLFYNTPDEAINISTDEGSLHTAKEIRDWGNEPCPHGNSVSRYPKRACDKCWAELDLAITELKRRPR